MTTTWADAKKRILKERWDCGECGQNVDGAEFHDYGCCILYKLEHGIELSPSNRKYLLSLGIETLKNRGCER